MLLQVCVQTCLHVCFWAESGKQLGQILREWKSVCEPPSAPPPPPCVHTSQALLLPSGSRMFRMSISEYRGSIMSLAFSSPPTCPQLLSFAILFQTSPNLGQYPADTLCFSQVYTCDEVYKHRKRLSANNHEMEHL